MKKLIVTIVAVFTWMLTVNAQVTYQVGFKELDHDIQKYIGKNYGGYTVDKAIQEQDKDGDISYTDVYVSKGGEKLKLLFDKKNKFIKKEIPLTAAPGSDTTKKQ
jgi:hypothetical protein